MDNVSYQSLQRTEVRATRPRIIRYNETGIQTFWVVLILEVILLLAVLAWIFSAFIPNYTPITATGNVAIVREAVWSRLTGSINDPLIEVQPGISVHESNLRGFSANDEIYYYYVVGNQNFDPLHRGLVHTNQIEIILRDDEGPLPIVIYKIREDATWH